MSTPHPLAELVDPAWAKALEPVAAQISELSQKLRVDVANGRGYLPAGNNVLRAFNYPFEDVRVLIVGQDPYPTPGHPIGLSFAVDSRVRPLPKSLQNIYRELANDLGVTPPEHGDISEWCSRGVMLLNRVLTVQPGKPASHRGLGWEEVTDHAIRALVARGKPLVAILWGKDAGTLRPLLRDTPSITSAHPSPLSAYRGFFNSRPFSRTNTLLSQMGQSPIDWQI